MRALKLPTPQKEMRTEEYKIDLAQERRETKALKLPTTQKEPIRKRHYFVCGITR